MLYYAFIWLYCTSCIVSTFSMGRLMKHLLIDFPTSVALTHVFGIGSVLGMYFALLAVSGLLLSMQYIPGDMSSMNSIMNIVIEAFTGNMLYIVHSVGAGTVFLLLYPHVGKFIMIRSYGTYAIMTGLVVLVLIVVSSFLGYVLVWLLMSFWAATVITTLLSVLPYGNDLLVLLWGSFTLDVSSLTRFYSLHYIVTLATSAMAILHLLALHVLGSTPNYMVHDTNDSVGFSRYYLIKDMILLSVVYLVYVDILYGLPTLFSDAELNISINTMSTPPHIVPEWYLLAYYATLRGIPSKIMGVIMVAYMLINVFMSFIPLNHNDYAVYPA